MRGFLSTEVWVAKSIPHVLFERAFKRLFPAGEVVNVVEDADPEKHPGLRFVEVQTFSDEKEKFWEFFEHFATFHGFVAVKDGLSTTYPRAMPHFE